MPQIERILCPIDFSEFSEKAYDYAQSLAWHYKATLFLQHVIDSLAPPFHRNPFPDSYNEICRNLRAGAEQQLQEFAEKHTRRGIQPHCSVSDGVATDLILGFAEAQAVNLIVMGTHGLRGIDHLTLGSVTEKVLRKARCPVLAVRKPAHDLVTPGESRTLSIYTGYSTAQIFLIIPSRLLTMPSPSQQSTRPSSPCSMCWRVSRIQPILKMK